MQWQASARILVHNSEAGTGGLLAASERRRNALAEQGFPRAQRPFETDDGSRLDQGGNFPAERAVSSGVSHTTPSSENSLSNSGFRFAIEKLNLVRWWQ